MERRDFLKFLGGSIGAVQLTGVSALLSSCGHTGASLGSVGIPISRMDKVSLIEGLNYQVVAKWDDPINSKEKFGFNNDFVAYLKNSNKEFLWVNHESVWPLLSTGWEKGMPRKKSDVDKEMSEVGGSFIQVAKTQSGWKLINSNRNFRMDAHTPIPFAWDSPIEGTTQAIGTLANCGGGLTPWGTILTCEENFEKFFGHKYKRMQWTTFYNRPAEHYGWVVEINPDTKKAKKLVSMGRFAHESATVLELPDGRLAVYMGDDKRDQHLYKFISEKPGSLERGELFVASLEKGKWLSLDINKQAVLKENFKDQTEIQINTRKAAELVGATPLARPEDIQIDPLTGNVIVALTNNKPKGNYHGELLKVEAQNNDHSSENFSAETFLAGGEETGFACPDNLLFDSKGNLWFTTDISEKDMVKPHYRNFGNNSLFVIPRTGANAGKAVRVANAPVDAEFTGPCFNDNEDTLFLSVQHPGYQSKVREGKFTSRWPEGGNTIPRSAVIAIQGFSSSPQADSLAWNQ